MSQPTEPTSFKRFLRTYTLHVLVNQCFKLLLYTIAQWQHMKDASVSLSYIARSDKQFVGLIFGISRSFSSNSRDPEARETLDAAARCY